MKAALNKMVEKTHGLILRFGHTSKNMAVQVDEYIGSQIDERYENLITGKPREDRKKRELVRFLSSIVFLLAVTVLVAVPVVGLFSTIKNSVIRHTIKSPDELAMGMANQEYNPDEQMLSDLYMPDVTAGDDLQDGNTGYQRITIIE